MKFFVRILIILIAGISLYYVFMFKENTKSADILNKPVQQIAFYHYFSGSLSGGINEMIDEVNTNQTDFKVTARPLDHEAFKSMIITTLDKGNPPELFSYWAGARVQNLINQDKLEPIDDLWTSQDFNSRFTSSIIESACTYQGHKYLVPINQFIVVFFYNKEIFRQHGLFPPESWDDFIPLCQKLKQKGITPIAMGSKERWPAQFWLDYLLLRSQQLEYRERLMNGQAKYTDAEVKQAYKRWSDILKKGYFNKNANALDWAEATELVCRKEAAMTLMGSWAIQSLENQEQCPDGMKDIDFFPFPVMDKTIPKVALGPIDGIVLSKKSANHTYAKQTLSYFAGKKPQERLSLGSGGLSPSLEVPMSVYSPFKKKIINEIQSSKAWAFNYDLATPPAVAELGMNSFQELIEFPDQYEAILDNLDSEITNLKEQHNPTTD